jgi:hypothetical protein
MPPNHTTFTDVVFNEQVAKALRDVDRILDLDRNPRLAEDVSHVYTDKYALANTLTNTAIIAQINVLDRLGLTKDVIQTLDSTKATTLRFQASDSCEFVKEQVVDVPIPTALQTTEETTTTGSFVGKTKKSTVKEVVNRVKEFHWNVHVNWEISVYSGTNLDQRLVLDSRTSTTTLIVQSATQQAPLPQHREHNPIELPLAWLLKQVDLENSKVHFTIDTQDRDTKTPRRNQQVEDALSFGADVSTWTGAIYHHFAHKYRTDIIQKHNPAIPDPSNVVDNTQKLTDLHPIVFVPVIPLMEEANGDENMQSNEPLVQQSSSQSVLAFPATAADGSDSSQSRVLSSKDITLLLNEQIQSLEKARETVTQGYPDRSSSKLITAAEAEICVLCSHSSHLAKAYENSIQYIEKMLEDQLVAAIGKRVTSADLDRFVKYHNAKFLVPPPKRFCYDIRRPNHNPEGVFTIESDRSFGEKRETIETHVRAVDGLSSLKFPLNAATTVELTGKTYLHGWLNHRFSLEHFGYHLTARARQFSSFMLVVGTMRGPDCMQPKDAIILQNKDEVKIPLLLNEIPTAKEFKDAIESLSPEQQRFAKAYRAMQLESSILGVCVIQIKPQLEDVLGLPHDSLTKEMKLTQDLMELFVEYQIPCDMLSYDGENEESTTKEKIDTVKGHVKAVIDVIQENQKKQLKEQEMKADMAMEGAFTDFDGPTQAIWTKQSNRAAEMAGYSPTSLGGSLVHNSMAMPRTRRPQTCEAERGVPSSARMMGVSSPTPPLAKISVATYGSKSAEVVYAAESMAVQEEAAFELPDFPDKTSLADNAPEMDSSSKMVLDFTGIPRLLDGAIEKFDADSALRSTTIKTGDKWTRLRQENLLTKPKMSNLYPEDIKSEKNKAFDLLDALSRSGSLPIPYSELHVVVCVTHCFDKSVMETVIQDNVNPIEKLEWSTLLLASTVHGVPACNLISNGNDRSRLATSFPALLGNADDNEN